MSSKDPALELKRLQKLWSLGLLDSRPEERFDQITRMAKRLFDVPIAMVGLIDDERQWFKSIQGASVCEMPRGDVFCHLTMAQNQTLVIEDTHKIKAYREYPVVTGKPFVRFYAGCPLHNGDEVLGTLCVVDSIPRQFSDEDKRALRDLASLIEQQISLSALAFTDELTGVLNRQGVIQASTQALGFCQRRGVPASLAFIDLDKFKSINDRFGHAEGDLALQAVSAALSSSFRSCDLIGRIGGDEFMVLMPSSDVEQAIGSLSRLSEPLQGFTLSSGQPMPIEYSYGVSVFDPLEPVGIERLLEMGDQRMYKNKVA